MSLQGKTYSVDEFNDKIGNLEFNRFDASYLQEQERYYFKDEQGLPLAFNTDNLTVAFDAKKAKKPENVSYKPKDKLEITYKVIEDSQLHKCLSQTLKEKIIDWVIKNLDSIRILNIESDDDEGIREEVEHMFKSPIYQKQDYPPNFSLRLEEFPKEGILFSNMIIKQDGTSIKNINDVIEDGEVKLFSRGTDAKSIIMLNYLTIREDSIRVNFKVYKVKIVGESSGIQVNYLIEEGDIDNINILPPKKAGEQGGKKSFYNYKGGQCGIDFTSDSGMVPKEWPIENTDKNTGNPYYSLCVPINSSSKWSGFCSSFDEKVIDIITKNSKEYTGKKLSKKLAQKYVKSILKYSKEDMDKIKNGEDPQYDPLLVISLPKYNDKFTHTFLDVDGNKLSSESLLEYHMGHLGCSYNMKVKIQHGWYGQKYSTKIVLVSIQIVKESQSSVAYTFDDEDTTCVDAGPEDDGSDDDDNGGNDEGSDGGSDGDNSSDNSSDED